MPINHPEVAVFPNLTATLWRYMELDRFESMLNRKALFFCRADKFADPFEGSIPKKEYDFRPRSHRAIDAFYGNQSTDEQIAQSIANMAHEHMQFRRRHVVNCWHMNSNESDAMWRLYLKSNEGVAIQTTTTRLIQALQNTPQEVDISEVRYIDYEQDGFYNSRDYRHEGYNLFMPLIHKRNEFIHERELRLIYEARDAYGNPNYWEIQEFEGGMFIEIDIRTLVDKIILPPTSDERVKEKIEAISQKFGFDFVFEKSALSKPALF